MIKRLWTEDSGDPPRPLFFTSTTRAERAPEAAAAAADLAGRRRRARGAPRRAPGGCLVHRADALDPLCEARLEAFRAKNAFVGRDAAHASATSRGPLLFKYRAYAAWGQGETAARDFDDIFDDFARDRFLIGDAAKVKDDILRFAALARTDHLLLRVQWPGLAQAETLANIERIGRIIGVLDEGAGHRGLPKTLLAIGVSAALTVFGSAEAPGQEKCKMSWEVPAANAKYTGQHAFDVGDVPGHQVRIFEAAPYLSRRPAELRGAEAGGAVVARLLGLRRSQRPCLGLLGDAARER